MSGRLGALRHSERFDPCTQGEFPMQPVRSAPRMLIIHEICKSYGASEALRGVSLEVRAGEIFGLLGPNGAGKTSLIRILMDVIRPDSGSISLFGEPRTRAHFDRMTYLPEQLGLYRRRRVLDTMAYLAELKGLGRGEARARGRSWLDRIGLAETAGWRVERLSKGMAQKVQLAAVLLPDPDLCVLDEPFSGLDPLNARWVAEELKARRALGKSAILSTHEMSKAESLCDRIGLIDRGRLSVYGAVGEIRRRFSRSQVEVDLESAPPVVPGIDEIEHVAGSTWRIQLGAAAEPSDVLTALVHAGARVGRFQPVMAPLEDVFMAVVGEENGE